MPLICNFSQIVFCVEHSLVFISHKIWNPWLETVFVDLFSTVHNILIETLSLRICCVPVISSLFGREPPESRQRIERREALKITYPNDKNLFSIIEITCIWRQNTLQFVWRSAQVSNTRLDSTNYSFHSYLSNLFLVFSIIKLNYNLSY